jgi:hypothetical protein
MMIKQICFARYSSQVGRCLTQAPRAACFFEARAYQIQKGLSVHPKTSRTQLVYRISREWNRALITPVCAVFSCADSSTTPRGGSGIREGVIQSLPLSSA